MRNSIKNSKLDQKWESWIFLGIVQLWPPITWKQTKTHKPAEYTSLSEFNKGHNKKKRIIIKKNILLGFWPNTYFYPFGLFFYNNRATKSEIKVSTDDKDITIPMYNSKKCCGIKRMFIEHYVIPSTQWWKRGGWQNVKNNSEFTFWILQKMNKTCVL